MTSARDHTTKPGMARLTDRLRALARVLPTRRERPPHLWRRRELSGSFVIGYIGTCKAPSVGGQSVVPENRRYAAALFRLGLEADHRLLLWVCEEAIGAAGRTVEAVHGGLRADLGQTSEEAKQWSELVEEVGAECRVEAIAEFGEFELALGGLLASTIGSLPRDLESVRGGRSPEPNFDLWDPARARPLRPEEPN
jgi:hypothetical protein